MMFTRVLLLISALMANGMVYGAEPIIPAPPGIAAESYLLLDADTGKVIVEKNSDQRLPPASLTKIMTSYIAAAEVERGVVSLEDAVDISVKAWQMEGSKMFVREGTKVKLGDLLRGVVIQSGNDASVAVAEHVAGSEESFVDMMNQQASALGMTDTHFVNATGWPEENHYTTAADLSKLTVSLINDYPEHYALYKEKYFTFNNIRQPNRNSLLWRDSSVDGVKTGHTEAAGYCLVASAVRDGMRLVSVVLNTDSEEARARESQKLLTYGFRYYDTVHLYDALESLKSVRIWGGARENLDLGVEENVVVTLPRGSRENLSAAMDIDTVIKAPVESGRTVGRLTVSLNDDVVYEGPLVALDNVEEAGFFSRIWDAIMLFFLQLFGGDPLAL
ncbi:MAG: D-alanyl-D-alanine carboxypeptidase [Pseudomonadales bacterium]|nr:D-alanyl-D-alanine carboxypeptidase [Pseudomonadales bacterium]